MNHILIFSIGMSAGVIITLFSLYLILKGVNK